ncbi:MAG: hypothetical protein QOI25_3192 [Mycobacterium sp.]|nr:hypothetical protein [Mycobacterium sp.]MDT5323063.1 hypothetical protein [Mycobacterium sp.]
MVALGKFREAILGDVAPRQVLVLVEWDSYVWQLFDRLDDLRPVLKLDR